MEQLEDGSEVQETTEADTEAAETTEETLTSEQIADLKRKAEVSSQNFERAKKAEDELKALRSKSSEVKQDNDLSPKDLLALMKADVPEEDIEEVQKAAKVLGVSVAEAIKDPVTKTVLERRAALRKTADASNTTTARPAAKKVSDEEVLSQAMQNDKLPDKGSSEAERLFWARRGVKK